MPAITSTDEAEKANLRAEKRRATQNELNKRKREGTWVRKIAPSADLSGLTFDERRTHKAQRMARWRADNLEELNEKARIRSRLPKSEAEINRIKAYAKEWTKDNWANLEKQPEMKRKWKIYYETNKKTLNSASNERTKLRRKNDPVFAMMCSLRSRLNSAIAGRAKNGSAVRDLGCTYDQFRDHIESQFDINMSWENRGRGGWVLDHLVPVVLYDLTDREQFLRCCHYTNLRPLGDAANIIKSKKLLPPLELFQIQLGFEDYEPPVVTGVIVSARSIRSSPVSSAEPINDN